MAKDVFLEDKESPVDPYIRLAHVLDIFNIAPAVHRDNMIAQARFDAHKTRDLVLFKKMIELGWKRKIREAIAIVGEENFFTVQIFFRRLQPLSYVGSEAGVSEC